MYIAPNTHLAQGDIFSAKTLGITSGIEIRLFRKHAGGPFDGVLNDLQTYNPSQVENFSEGLELIQAHARILDYHILLSQTCDISGLDKDRFLYCHVAPVITLASALQRKKLPFKNEKTDEDVLMTIEDVLVSSLPEELAKKLQQEILDPFKLPATLRQVLKDWAPSKAQAPHRNKIKDFFNNIIQDKFVFTFYLPEESALKVPAAYVDLTQIYMVPVTHSEAAMSTRVASIKSPYREAFSQKLARLFERVALPGVESTKF